MLTYCRRHNSLCEKSNLEMIHKQVNDDLNTMSEWLKCNKVSLIASKSEYYDYEIKVDNITISPENKQISRLNIYNMGCCETNYQFENNETFTLA